ncbi:thioredoxin family protein [bacterium SCSIO 12741]|nr:thioredoxin family protein [bacterium SCSIO 12741]
MALVESNMMELGTPAPIFQLPDTVSGKLLSLQDLRSEKATVVMFICNHCPYVIHVNEALVKVARKYQEKGIQFIAISSNNVETHPQDGPEYMTRVAQQLGYPFPYLYDETQDVAKAYGAECTPDFFVFDQDLKCAYRGRFDDSRPGMGQASGTDLCTALDAILAEEPVDTEQYPSMGCSIKWK